MPTVRHHIHVRGLAPALVLVALIWRAGQLIDAAGVAYETVQALRGNPDLSNPPRRTEPA